LIPFSFNLSSLAFDSGLLILHQFDRLPGEERLQQRNNILHCTFVLDTPGFIFRSLPKLVVNPVLLVASGYANCFYLFSL
jgi:hypothetical protein